MPITYIKDQPIPETSIKEQGLRKIDEEKLKKACMDFESLFIHQMLKSMRQTISKTNLFGEGPAEEIFQSLFDQELSRSLVNREGLGLGKMLHYQMLQRLRNPSPVTDLKPFRINQDNLGDIYRREDERFGK
jgi:flagellar protein FlgJ